MYIPSNVKLKETQEVDIVFRHPTLVGTDCLQVVQSTITSRVVRKVDQKTGKENIIGKTVINEKFEPLCFKLEKVTPEILRDFRKKKIPSFVLKSDGVLFHTVIPETLTLIGANILGPHKCAVVNHECNRLSAASDRDNGCAKVRNKSQFIEIYPWIETGFETFATESDAFMVIKCNHYEKMPPRKKFTPEELRKAKLSLAQFFWDDI